MNNKIGFAVLGVLILVSIAILIYFVFKEKFTQDGKYNVLVTGGGDVGLQPFDINAIQTELDKIKDMINDNWITINKLWTYLNWKLVGGDGDPRKVGRVCSQC